MRTIKTLNYLCNNKSYDYKYRNHKIRIDASFTANAERKLVSETKNSF
jgi:hypothetical protein